MNIRDIINIFFPREFSDKYIHIGYSHPSVPGGWVDIVKNSIIEIEKKMWPQRYLPLFIKRLIHYLAKGNSIYHTKFFIFEKLRNYLTKDQIITTIKDKFAMLRIYGNYNKDIGKIIEAAELKCINICEECGSNDDVGITGKFWVVNTCTKCRNNGG